jgi:hypothetical protein
MFMIFRQKPPQSQPRQRQRARKPSLEALEDRLQLATFTPIPLGSAASFSLATVDPTYPTGSLTFSGVPFVIAPAGNNVVWNNTGPSTGTIVKDIPVGVAGVTAIHTLINTTFGQPGPNSYLRLDFFGSGGANYTVALIGNEDIRDLNNGSWTNSINGTSTVNVFITGLGYRMDKQTIDLPAEFANQTLTNIRMTDTGAFDFQRAILYGITVASNDLTDIAMQSAQLQGPTTVQFTYETTGNPGPFEVGLYRSTDGITYNPADLIATQTVTPPPSGQQGSGTFTIPSSWTTGPDLPYLLVVADPSNAISELAEDNNSRPIALPDLVGSSFHYRVPADATNEYDGPLPFNATVNLFDGRVSPQPNPRFRTTVTNQGVGSASRFEVAVYASEDSTITSADVKLGDWVVNSLAPGATTEISLGNLRLPDNQRTASWFGRIYLGMIVDPTGSIVEINSNNSNRGDGLDRIAARLYDPISHVSEITSNLQGISFGSDPIRGPRLVREFLRVNGFQLENGWLGQLLGGGWVRNLPANTAIVSRFDGESRPGNAYRQQAFMIAPNQSVAFYDVASQQWVNRARDRYWILLQGTQTVAEPDPRYALFRPYNVQWLLYVLDWHTGTRRNGNRF